MEPGEHGYAILDAVRAFALEKVVNTADEGQLPFSEEGAYVLGQAFGQVVQGGEPDAYACFELGHPDGELWTLVLVEEAAHLVRFAEGRAEIRFLGRPRGEYSEDLESVQHGTRITGRFAHPKIPAGSLEFSIDPVVPQIHVAPATRARYEQLERLRTIFRRWAQLPAAP